MVLSIWVLVHLCTNQKHISKSYLRFLCAFLHIHIHKCVYMLLSCLVVQILGFIGEPGLGSRVVRSGRHALQYFILVLLVGQKNSNRGWFLGTGGNNRRFQFTNHRN